MSNAFEDLRVGGDWGTKSITGTLGAGRGTLRATTVSGSIALLRRPEPAEDPEAPPAGPADPTAPPLSTTRTVPGYYSYNSQDVLLPAFMDAYWGRTSGGYEAKKFDPFALIPLPNWTVEYRTLADLPGASATVSPDQHYQLSLVDGSVTATAYTARATARSGSPQSGDSRCLTLQVAVNGGTIVYSSAGSGGANAAPDPCWVR